MKTSTPRPRPVDLSEVTTYPLSERRNLEKIERFARPCSGTPSSCETLLAAMPEVLRARELRHLVDAVVSLHLGGRQVVAAIGGHVLKCGLGPLLIDLMERGILTGLALNGAGMIHDYEFALLGESSEDVGEGLLQGRFGMARETAAQLEEAVAEGAREGVGLGAVVGRAILRKNLPHSDVSVLAAAYRLGLPATVHVAFGTDVLHQHPGFDPAATGVTTHTDFRLACGLVAELEPGGAWLNIGSATILPEVFLKALSVAANLGHRFEHLVTADFDMVERYRPRVNVVQRPVSAGGQGFSFLGHHEILIPLLYWLLLCALDRRTRDRSTGIEDGHSSQRG